MVWLEKDWNIHLVRNLEFLTDVEWETVPAVDSSPQTKLVQLTEKSYGSLHFHGKSMTANQIETFKKICNSFCPEMHVTLGQVMEDSASWCSLQRGNPTAQ